MALSSLLRAAITTCGLFALNTTVALAQAPAGMTAEPTFAVQTPADSSLPSGEWQSCRYKPLSGSHIKVQVCTAKDGLEYRMDRRARTIAVVISGIPVSAPVAAPLPQVQ